MHLRDYSESASNIMAEGKHILYIGVALGVIYMLIARWFLGHRRRIAVPRAGIDPGFLGIHLSAAKEEFRLRGHELVDEGYHRVKSLYCPMEEDLAKS